MSFDHDTFSGPVDNRTAPGGASWPQRNPHPPGSALAAQWNIKRALHALGGVTMAEFAAHARRVHRTGLSARDLLRRWGQR